MRLLEESETEMHPRYERLCQEMIALTCYPGPHTADSLARRMFRNKQQIQSDLRWWQGILKVSGLTLSVGRQITVEGPEWTIRGFVMSMLFSFSTAAVRRRILPVAVRDDRPLRPAVSGALHRRDAARPRLRVLQQRAMAVRRVPLHYGDPPSPRPWPDGVARRRRVHAVLRLPQEAARAPFLPDGERRRDGTAQRHGPLLHLAMESGR